ncbi:ABC transporter ATP-binding protein [Rhodococcus sp. BP-241]|uniref:ABC transporter ATP-binding protein n=1 Tax=Rhodococcus sp. BP-241 TaxID=2739441 RepID=UPI001C9B77E1|nr:ABC transporter ATP-binding protein [Rhodococcus sp. BP-241]MBY6708381.1 ABC transporter ATP-binding protein [Rhodococcus sp. BP-241]
MTTATPDAPGRLPNLRLLWTFIRPHRRLFRFGLLLGLLVTASSLATPLVTKRLLDSFDVPGATRSAIVLLVGLLVVGIIVGLAQRLLLGTMAERVVLEARSSMVRRFFGATIPAVTARPAGEMLTRVTSDTMLLREASSWALVEIVNGSIAIVGVIVLMATLDLPLLGTALLGIGLIGVAAGFLMPKVARAQRNAQEAMGRLGGILEGALRAVRTVKASRAESRSSELVIEEARVSASYGIRAVRLEAWAWTITGSGIQLTIIAVLGVGAYRVSSGALAVSSLVAFLLYAFQLVGPVAQLTLYVSQLQRGIAAAARIREVQVMDLEKEAPTAVADLPASAEVSALTLTRVTAGYGDEGAAVNAIDMSIPSRGHTAVVGPSGAGKTTLFSLILRFLEPRTGELALNGVPYSALSHSQIRARIGYVEQATPTLPGTIADNLRLTHPDATDAELWAALERVRLAEKIELLPAGLATELRDSAVSGGERQRIALARAIVRPPDILLLDEATAQVDGITEAAIHDAIRDLSVHGAVVTIAHRLSTVIDADTIFVLERGRVRSKGTHRELLDTDTLYRDLVEALRIAV